MASALLMLVSAFTLTGQAARVDAPTAAAGTVIATVAIAERVLANGTPLLPGRYELRLTGEFAKPGPGQAAQSEEWVAFVQNGEVRGRAVAILISPADVRAIADGPVPAEGASRVERLKGDDYLRIWVHARGQHYLLHLPTATHRGATSTNAR